MAGRFLGPVQWRPLGQNREQTAMLQPSARVGLEWLFQQIGQGSGVRQGLWVVDLGPGIRGAFRAIAIQGPDGFKRAFVDLEITRETSDSETSVSYLIYHGWARVQATGGGRYRPDNVYCNAGLVAYILGDGTEIPGTSPPIAQVIFGRAESDVPLSRCQCPDDTATPPNLTGCDYRLTWPEPPTLGASQEYPWPHAGTNVDGIQPIWSGEARLWYQSLAGVAKSPAEMLPLDFAALSTETGIVWMGKRLWALHIGMDGIQAVELLVPDELACVMRWLIDGKFSGLDETIVRALIYAHAKAPNDATVRQLATAAQMSAAYAGGGWLNPYLGWQFYWQPDVTSSARAIGTLYSFTTTHQSHTVKIEFALIDDVPKAVIRIGDLQPWGGELFRLRLVSGALLAPIGTTNTSDVIVHSWTTTNGGMCQLVKNRVSGSATETITMEAYPNLCKSESWSGSESVATTSSTGGWRITGSTSASATVKIPSGGTWTNVSVTQTAGTEILCGSGPIINYNYLCQSNLPYSLSTTCNQGRVGEYWFTPNVVTVVATETQESSSGGSGAAIASFVGGDNGAAIAYKTTGGSTQVRKSVFVGTNCAHGYGVLWYHNKLPTKCTTKNNTQFTFTVSNPPGWLGGAHFGGSSSPSVPGSVGWFVGVGYNGAARNWAPFAPAPPRTTSGITMIGSDGVARELPVNKWESYLSLYADETPIPYILVSAVGNAVWRETPDGNQEITGDTNKGVLNGFSILPIGAS